MEKDVIQNAAYHGLIHLGLVYNFWTFVSLHFQFYLHTYLQACIGKSWII